MRVDGAFQELSGFTRSNQRDQQDAFWDKVRGGASDFDLETNERLCAVAFIKRFFPSVSREAIGRNLDPRGWPSTVTIAALPWMRAIANSADENFCLKAKAYADEAASEKGADTVKLEPNPIAEGISANGGTFSAN